MYNLPERVRNIILKHVESSEKGLILSLRVRGGERENYLTIEGDELVFCTNEDEARGRTNAALLKFISRELNIPISRLDIIYGQRGSLKRVLIKDYQAEALVDKLSRLIKLA